MAHLDVEQYRQLFPVLKKVLYLNPGTYGPVPTPVADTLRDWYTMLEQEGPWSPVVVERSQAAYEDARTKVADILGAKPGEIALTRSVTDGTNIVANGLPWQAGDEVIVSDQEHESGWVNWQLLAKRYGIVIKMVELTADLEKLTSGLDALMTPRTKVVFLSHVSCQTGLRIPAKKVAAFVHERGALFMLDGAHAVGQVPVDMRDLGCDFYAGCGHKWLMGPQGTGFLYIAEERLKDVEPTTVGWGSRSRVCTGPGDDRLLWADGALRFEHATRPWALYAALGTSIELIQRIGVENIFNHVQTLVRPFKAALAELPNMQLVTPMEAEGSVGLVGLRARGYNHEVLSTLYKEQQVLFPYNKREDGLQWMRIAVAYFIYPSELDRVLEIMRSCAPA